MNQVVPSSTLEHSSIPRKRPLNPGNSLRKWVRQSTSRAIRRHKPAAIALGCLSLNNPLRKLCLAIVMWKWFERFIMVCVLFNTLLLGLVDYTNAVDGVPNPLSPRNMLIDRVNSISLYIFIGEATIKIIALGFVQGKGTYLSDGWNRLDFIIIVSGAFSLFYSSGKLGVLRVLRILRPLRALHSVPGLKVLSGSLLSSLPALGNVAIILAFSYLVFAILGMELWRNSWHYRCRLTPFPVRFDPLAWNATSLTLNTSYLTSVMGNPDQYRCLPINNNDTWPNLMPCIWPTDPAEDSNTPWLCSASTSWGRQCGTNRTCGSNYDPYGNPRFSDLLAPGMTSPLSIMRLAEFNQNLNFGYTSFDNVYSTFVIIIQIVTASGWMVLTETTQDAGGSIAAFIYFNAIFFIGACFLLQLNMAVLFSEFEKAKEQHSRMVDNQRRLSMQSSFTGSFKSLPSRTMLAVPKLPRVVDLPKWTAYSTFQKRLKKIVKTKKFSRLSMLMTIANVAVLTTDHHPSSRFYQEVCDVLNSIFLLYFFVEMTMKMLGLSVSTYWSDKFNRFDCFTVVTGIVEMMLNPPFYIDGTISGASGFTALRAIRAIKLARAWKSLNKLLMSIMAAMGEILNFLFFLVLFLYIFALLGMEVFATRFQFDSNNYPMPYNSTSPSVQTHRSNFDTILWAFFTVFQVITYDNYSALIWDGWISAGWIAPLYFSGIVVLGVWVVMNMFSAILVESVMVESQEANSTSDTSSTESNEGEENLIASGVGPPFHNRMIKHAQASQVRRLRFALRRVLQLHHHLPPNEFMGEDGHIAVFEGKSLCLFSLRNPLRHYCIQIVGHKAFTIFISLVIGFSCIMTAMDTPLLDPNSDVGRLINACNYTFAVIFTSELVMNVIAKGLLFGSDAYMKDGWRILDAFIVAVSLIPLLVQTTSAVTGLRALRSLRALRPLRVINKLPQLKVVVNTLFRCLPDMGRAFLFVGFMLYIFGIMTTILFKGAIQTCSSSPYNYGTNGPPPWFPQNYSGSFSQDDLNDFDIMTYPRDYFSMGISTQAIVTSAYASCGLSLNDIPTSKQVCLCFNQTWSSPTPQVFDNIIWSVGGLYELTTLEGWTAVALACIDSVGPDMQPIPNSRLWVMVFWWIFIIVCSFFVTNLFIAVLCDAFMRENYGTLITEEQMQWIKLQRQVLAMRPHVVYPVPTNLWRRVSYRIVHFTYFEHL
ncbi:Voltage-gated Ion Channel (VIC) Superfamily, partial [Thraustotheca clavata]